MRKMNFPFSSEALTVEKAATPEEVYANGSIAWGDLASHKRQLVSFSHAANPQYRFAERSPPAP